MISVIVGLGVAINTILESIALGTVTPVDLDRINILKCEGKGGDATTHLIQSDHDISDSTMLGSIIFKDQLTVTV